MLLLFIRTRGQLLEQDYKLVEGVDEGGPIGMGEGLAQLGPFCIVAAR